MSSTPEQHTPDLATGTRNPLVALIREGLLPARDARPSQRERYRRIVAAAMELASEGGYDAVQMREVAERADVALGTVYRYFPSKNHLLVVGMLLAFEGLRKRLESGVAPGDTPAERLMYVLDRNNRLLEKDHARYEALMRAYMFADASAAAELDAVNVLMAEMFTRAVGTSDPDPGLVNALRVVGDVWMSSLVSWVAGRMTVEAMDEHLATTVRLVFAKLDEQRGG
ncbi:TetR family transcriptional regulator [Rhodococcus sp. HNM0569]|uniref:TetR family transcriptional regulator n=1 Tax=Rhodococcus sp. HNM0569 TaxID=2716340 RepID=UPI00146A9601|nr:TetR family transcriptional regulator [Rhodococcus sp. HNM0569]NLU82374.1 TetR/AcrR family transcriptional regulator [Rhodococcus sp. HNM0569]